MMGRGRARTQPEVCVVDGCGNPTCSRNLCEMHYARVRRTGSTAGRTRPRVVPWTEMDDAALRAHEGLSTSEVAKLLGRSPDSIRSRRRLIRNDAIPVSVERWTEEEDRFIRSTPHFSPEQQARHLGRAVSSTKHRRRLISKKYGIALSSDTNPNEVGTRRLLARTCVGCGLLLDATWFTRHSATQKSGAATFVWRTRCSRCESTSGRESGARWARANAKQAREASKRAKAELQRITRAKASRNGFPWLQADHATLRDTSLTVFEKAIKLGRTYAATGQACSANGYTSRVGKGDPMHGVWHIDNPNELEQAS